MNQAFLTLQNGFTLASNSLSIFFNGFTAGVKIWGAATAAQFFLITKAAQKLFESMGADKTAERFKGYSEFMKQTTKAFAAEVVKDANDIKTAWNGIYDGLAEKSQVANEKAKRYNMATIDQILNYYPKVEAAVKKTAEAAKAAFADAADALEQINAAETRTELADLGVTLAQAFADGTLTQEQYSDALDASKKKLSELKTETENAGNATKGMGDAAERAGRQQASGAAQAGNIAGALAGHYDALTSELNSLSGAAYNAFEKMQGVGNLDTRQSQGDIANLKNELKEAQEEAHRLNTAVSFDITGIDEWMRDTAENAAHIKQQFLEQKVALEELIQSYEQGNISAGNFASEGRAAAETMNLLNQQDLDRLNNAIQSAENSISQLADSSRNTLDSLKDELDQLQGKQDEIEKRKYENRQKDLKQQQSQAQAKGDQTAVNNLSKALNLSDQIFNERRRKAQEEAQKEQTEKRQVSTRSQKASPEVTPSRIPQKIIRLEYPGGGLNVGIAPKDETRLLEALKNAGLRSL